jgi:uncharacterized membrane protein YhaH (DUF805 family)
MNIFYLTRAFSFLENIIIIIIIISGSTVLVSTLAISHRRFRDLIKTPSGTLLDEREEYTSYLAYTEH